MANTFITPQMVARRALATLYNNSVMLPLVYRDVESDFVPGVGATIQVRKPATFTANPYNQAVGILLQNGTETHVDVTLDKHYDVSIPLTSTDYTLKIDDLQTQIISPAMEAISQAIDTLILSLRTDITQSVTLTAYNESSHPHPAQDLVTAGRKLTSAKVPLTGRVAVVDEFIAASLKMDALMNRSDWRGQAGLTSALSAGQLPPAFGFDPYETNNIDDFTGVGFVREAFAFASRPLALPNGAARAEVVSYKGLSVRVIYDYDPTYKQDILSLDVLCGVKTLDATRAVLLAGLADSA